MSQDSKYNIVSRLQRWIDSVPGQTFLNYAYSWGASVVILGTLFKLTHLPGANIMLFIGMGTEVVVFFISAFDRPFDKTSADRELAYGYTNGDENETAETTDEETVATNAGTSGTTVIIGGTSGGAAAGAVAAATNDGTTAGNIIVGGGGVVGGGVVGGVVGGGEWTAEQQQASDELAEAQENYIDQLNKLTETLQKVAEQGERLARDSEEMENLNRTLTSICRVYEMQLKGASQQIGTLDQINDKSRKMAEQIEQLNNIYSRMIEAMTVNMRTAAPTDR